MNISLLAPFDTENTAAYIYSYDQFLNFNENRKVSPYDGTIGGVLIDGCLANINVTNWKNYYSWANNFIWMSLRDLEQFFPRDVRIVWYGD